jgi:hypothetical protein
MIYWIILVAGTFRNVTVNCKCTKYVPYTWKCQYVCFIAYLNFPECRCQFSFIQLVNFQHHSGILCCRQSKVVPYYGYECQRNCLQIYKYILHLLHGKTQKINGKNYNIYIHQSVIEMLNNLLYISHGGIQSKTSYKMYAYTIVQESRSS